MDSVSILSLVGTVARLLITVNDVLGRYREWQDKHRNALSTLRGIRSECTTTEAVARSLAKIIKQESSELSGEQNALIGILGSNVRELVRLVSSLDRSINYILRDRTIPDIRSAIVKKEGFFTGKLQKIRDKRGLVESVTRVLELNDIREVKTRLELIATQLGLGATGAGPGKDETKSRELLEETAGQRRPDVIRRLLNEGADPNFLAIDLRPPDHPRAVIPLLYALRTPPERCYEAVDILLSNGALANLVVGDEPPLWQAFASGNIELATRLLDAGADVEFPCVKGAGRSLLGWVVFSEDSGFADRRLELIELALEYGVNTEAKAPNGNTPLHDAVEMRKGPEVVDLLLRANAFVDSRARDSLTPLMIAAQIGDEEVAGLLLVYAADPTLLSKDGLTAAVIARRADHVGLADMLDTFD